MRIWFQKAMLKHRLKRILSKDTRPHQQIPSRRLCHEIAVLLEPVCFRQHPAGKRLQTTLHVLYPNIGRYTRRLKEINLLLKHSKAIPADAVTSPLMLCSMDLFFTDDSKVYVPLELSYEAFRTQVLTLCALMEASDTATFGVHEHNLRMLTNVFLNLEDLLKKLAGSIS